uniref:Uncharacterized protein n=1 Tax=Candidatus Kentrum sp. FM TaxID=2126340 RepID=A0A450SA71_9GAMM|nr:MAG: hypothetical protein BECKFM1743A_GA0114220_100653 [Candidatus Kentron sp. FM]VFJ49345.1 MAG: hypothetical protein BECKFM1743C_GA0114222_100703 [Candidatus Kentron sp. FM]VFK08259.1 MAG: hypothetical protein BECKFM1743B_GA0114221_100643 [Candidatus Kentron sp. FM]
MANPVVEYGMRGCIVPIFRPSIAHTYSTLHLERLVCRVE